MAIHLLFNILLNEVTLPHNTTVFGSFLVPLKFLLIKRSVHANERTSYNGLQAFLSSILLLGNQVPPRILWATDTGIINLSATSPIICSDCLCWESRYFEVL